MMTSNTTNLTNTTTTVVTTSVTTPLVAPSLGGAAASFGGVQGRIPSMYSLGMIASTLDNFNGKDVVRYLEKLEQRAKLDGWTEEETLNLLKYKCVGEAYDFLKSDSGLDRLDFRSLKARLIDNFAITRLPGENQLHLSKCFQRHDENVSSYCTRLRILGARVLEEDLRNATIEEQPGIRKKNQDLILNQFKMGLRKDIMKEVGVLMLREDKLTLDKAEELVKFYEISMKMVEGRSSGRQVLQLNCYICGRVGHISRDCRSQRHGSRQEQRSGCFVCNKLGHWARECPMKLCEDKGPRENFGQGTDQRKWDSQRRGDSTQSVNTNTFHGRQDQGNPGTSRGDQWNTRRPEVQEGRSRNNFEGTRNNWYRHDITREGYNNHYSGNTRRTEGNQNQHGEHRSNGTIPKDPRRKANESGNTQSKGEQPSTYQYRGNRIMSYIERSNQHCRIKGNYVKENVYRNAQLDSRNRNSIEGVKQNLRSSGNNLPSPRKESESIMSCFNVEEETEEDDQAQNPYVVSLQLNGRICQCLVDTGAAVSLIKKKLITEEGLHVYEEDNMVLTGITGHPLQIYGLVHVNLSIPTIGARIGGSFIVCDDNIFGERREVDILLGRDFLSEHKVDIMCRQDPVIRLYGRCLPGANVNRSILDEEISLENASDSLKKAMVTNEEDERLREDQWKIWLQEVKNFYQKNRYQESNQKCVTAQVHCSADGMERVMNKVMENQSEHHQKEQEQWNLKGPKPEILCEIETPNNMKQTISDLQHRLKQVEESMGELIEVCKSIPATIQNNITSNEVNQGNEKELVKQQQMRHRIETNVLSVEDVIIPPRTEVRCLGKVKHDLKGKVLVCEPVETGNKQVHVACAVVNNTDVIPVRIINFSETKVKINKGQRIGVAVSGKEDPERLEGKATIGKIDISNDKWIEEGFDLTHLDNGTRQEMYHLLRQYADLFREEDDILTSTTKVKHNIILEPGSKPICKAPYRIPYKQREVLEKEIDRLLKAKIIRPSCSPWSAPVVLVTKTLSTGEEKIRMCIDYRGLNSVTQKEYYPLPNISDLIQGYKAGQRVLFSVIDVAEAYHQIDVNEEDIPLTGFSTFQGHYEYLKMPFGLVNAPATFQRFMNLTLSGLTGELCMVYLDDIIVYNSDGESGHIKNLEAVFARLREANIKLKPRKCSFLLQKVKYLGHIITREGVLPDPEKIEVISKFPIPRNVKGVRSFLGLVNWYRRFIPNVAQLSAPLVNLTKKDVIFKIDQDVLNSIDTLKKALKSDSLLIYPDFEQPFILATDASGKGMGVVLSQMRDGYERPIAFASKQFKKAELSYSTTEKELYAVVFGIKTFNCYLYGHKFKVITDHRPLRWLFSLKDPSSRLTRWSLLLAEYDFEVIHRAGRMHGNADALSRMYNNDEYFINLTYEEFQEYQKEYPIPRLETIKVVYGDLFTAPAKCSLAHCVSQDFRMGQGIAANFKKFFGGEEELRKQGKIIGEVAQLRQNGRNIYYLITKQKYYEKPRYEDVWNALKNLRWICEQNQDQELAMPKIGCGLDGLRWDIVLEMINFVFYGSNLEITVYMLPPINSVQVNLVGKEEEFEPIWDKNVIKYAQETDTYCQLIKSQLADQESEVIESYYFDNDGVLYKVDRGNMSDKLVVPKSFVAKVMEGFHDSPLAGHQGQQKTFESIKRKFYWPNMRADINQYCKVCVSCNQRKTSPHFKKAPLQRFTKTSEPWELTSMDIVGPLVTSMQGNRYLLTFQDYFTKYPEAIPLPDQKAETVARAFVENIIVRHGVPKKLLTDQGSNFVSKLFKEVCKLLGIEKIETASYAPTSNGQIERMHRVLKDILSHYLAKDQRDWDKWIPFALMAYRGNIHSTTGYSPFFLLHGRDQVVPIDNFLRPNRVRYDYDENYVSELMERFKQVYTKVHEITEKVKSARIARFNESTKDRTFKPGDLVYVKNVGATLGISKKLTKPWEGPYRIIDIVGPVTYKVRKVGSWQDQIVHVNRLKEYYEVENKNENKGGDTQVSLEESDEELSEEEEENEPKKPILLPFIPIPVAEDEVRQELENMEAMDRTKSMDDIKIDNDEEQVSGSPIFLRRSTRIRRPPDRLDL